MMGALGRIKKSLPSSSRHTGLGLWGRGYANAVRDGWISTSAPAWNYEAKLKRASHNGPMMLSSPLSTGVVGHIALSTPTPIDGIGQWGGIDTSCVVSVPDLASGGTFGVTTSGLPQRWTGLYMDGVISRYSPPHTTPEMLMGNVSEENKLRSDILTFPLTGSSHLKSSMAVPEQDSLSLIKKKMVSAGGGGAIPDAFTMTTGYWKVYDLGSSMNKDYSAQHWHWSTTFMRGATTRDAIQSGAEGAAEGSASLFFYDPRQLSLIGGSWYTWAGSYMPAQCWLDPYNPRPFSVTTALLTGTTLAALDSKSTTIILEGDLGELSPADTGAGTGPQQAKKDSMTVYGSDHMNDWGPNGTVNFGSSGNDRSTHLHVLGAGRNLDFAGAINPGVAEPFYASVAAGGSSTHDNVVSTSTGANPNQPNFLGHFRDLQNGCDSHLAMNRHVNMTRGVGFAGVTNMTFGGGTSLRDCKNYNLANKTVTNNELDTPIRHLNQGGLGLCVYVLGDYYIDKEFGDHTPADLLPLDWMFQVYTDHVFEEIDSATYRTEMCGPDGDAVGSAFYSEGVADPSADVNAPLTQENGVMPGVTLATGMNPLSNNNSNPIVKKKVTRNSWFEDHAGDVKTVYRRETILDKVSPWSKSSGTEGGFSRASYTSSDLQHQDDGLRTFLMGFYDKTTVGLTNDFFRQYQVVN